MPATAVALKLWVSAGTTTPSAVPSGAGVRPNEDGLPGLSVLRQIVGALLTWGCWPASRALSCR